MAEKSVDDGQPWATGRNDSRDQRGGHVEHKSRLDSVTMRNRQMSVVEQVAAAHVHEVNEREDMQDIISEAKAAADNEHSMTLMEGLRTYPKAMGWSIALSTCIIMEGYDTLLLGSFYAMPAFNRKFGTKDAAGKYSLTAAWQDGLSDGAGVGEILGLYISGWLADRFGYKKVLAGALIMIIGFIFINFFAVNLIMLQVGEILCGIPWGVFQTITTTYAAEVCPVQLRAYLTTYVNLCWVLGQLIGSGVVRGMLNMNNKWSYKIPFAIQWVWPIPILVAVLLAPESPWWLIRKGRNEDAERAVARLGRSGGNFNPKETVAMMIHTNEVEKKIQSGTSYFDCFKGSVNRRRTEIACITWICQSVCGSSFMGNSTYFYEQAGLVTSDAFDMSIAQYVLGAIGTVLSWFLMLRVGRRKIYVWGLFTLTVLLFIIGCLGIPHHSSGTSWAVGTLLLIYTFVYDFTVGPICYSLVAEIPSSRLRQKTVVLARNAYNISGTAYTGVIGLYMLNPTAWNWGAKAGFFWAGNCGLCFLWAYFRLPEPKGRTYAELDVLFDQRVPARKFAQTEVNPYELSSNDSQEEILPSEK
jgi:SP family general alpha glucoside:H+ symporter-like MFS transporter